MYDVCKECLPEFGLFNAISSKMTEIAYLKMPAVSLIIEASIIYIPDTKYTFNLKTLLKALFNNVSTLKI